MQSISAKKTKKEPHVLAEVISQIRHEMVLSQADIAGLLGIPETTFQRYENGTARMPEKTWEKLQAARERLNKWQKSMPKTIARRIARDFPNGIIGG